MKKNLVISRAIGKLPSVVSTVKDGGNDRIAKRLASKDPGMDFQLDSKKELI
jgi:hypothetical protein